MRTLDENVEYDARTLMCAILSFRDTRGEWPIGRDVVGMSVYKTTRDRLAVWDFMDREGWLRVERAEGLRSRPRRCYVATDTGRAAVLAPEPLPSVIPERPVPFPDDPVESVIYGYHLSFFYRRGRWPRGAERATAFKGERTKHFLPERRREAYEQMRRSGIFVRVTFRSGRGDSTYFIMPDISPEYADKDGWVFYGAPTEAP